MGLINYRGFDLEYVVKLIDAHIKDMVGDTLCSEYLTARMRATYLRYI